MGASRFRCASGCNLQQIEIAAIVFERGCIAQQFGCGANEGTAAAAVEQIGQRSFCRKRTCIRFFQGKQQSCDSRELSEGQVRELKCDVANMRSESIGCCKLGARTACGFFRERVQSTSRHSPRPPYQVAGQAFVDAPTSTEAA